MGLVQTRGRVARWMLVLAVAVGLVGMHHLLAHDPDAPAGGAALAESMTYGMPSGTAAMTAAMTAAGPVAPVSTRTRPHLVSDADRATVMMPSPGHDLAMGMLMHLCLAVLGGLIVLGLAAVAVTIRVRQRLGPTRFCGVVTVRPRSPPRIAVRLAQLCVLRN